MKRVLGIILFTVALCSGQPPPLSITYGATGLSAVNYNGFQYLSYGNFGVNGINLLNAAGKISAGSTAGTAVYDAAHLRTTIKFSWGKIIVAYATSANKLILTITTSNASPSTIQGVFYEPLRLQFPSAPQEFDGVDPIIVINNGNPTALRMTAGANALVLANDDVVQPLLVGFPWSLNKPANTIFPVRVETSQDSMLPNSIPFVNRPIAPGASDTYHISLRFGAASASTKSLAADVYQSFATVYPFTVNWPDRRPIGQLIMGSTAAGFATNPRGWFNDPTVDVTTPQGIAAFQTRVLAWAQNAVTILKSMNAQGMVTWDIEGEQYPQPTTYIGDPAVFGTLAPEMNGVIDQYFQTFTSAGFRVGICIRPQQLVIPPGGGAPTQTTVTDPTQVLLSKVAYAYNRWGATLFYIDSNGDPNFPISSSFFKTVAAQYPNVLLIPEHQTASYFGFGSWYGELRGGFTGTPSTVLDIYPSAFSVIYLPDGNFPQSQAALQASATRGDIMMFRAWYTDPQNQEILSLYPSNGVAAPAPSIVTPANNSTVNGTVTITASAASGPAGVAGVQYALDGANIGGVLTAPPFPLALDTGALSPGIHQVQAVASDTLGDLGYSTNRFFVSPVAGNPPPAISFSAPAPGAAVSGPVTVSAAVMDNLPVFGVQFTLDGSNLGPLLTFPPYNAFFDSTTLANGTHVLGVTATDQIGNLSQTAETVFTGNVPLSIAITAPVAGSTVSQTVAVVASVSGTAAVSGVQFALDGIYFGGFLTVAPYTATWVSNLAANGAHTLSVTVFDTSGHMSSNSETVISENAAAVSYLTGSVSTPTTTQNLTTGGAMDWIHWGLNNAASVDRKAAVVPQISNYAVIGPKNAANYTNNLFGFSWTDGAPTVQVTKTNTGLYVAGKSGGFSLSAPADTTPRTLTLYAGVYKAQASLVAQLSDFSAPVYQDTSVVNLNGQSSVAYLLSYQAASASQTLLVTFTQVSNNVDATSNVTLQAAALSGPVANPPTLSGTVTFPSTTQNLTALGTADWTQWNGTTLTPTDRKANVPAQMSGLSMLGSSVETPYSNNPFGFSWTDGAPLMAAVSINSGAYTMGQGSGFSVNAPADTNWRTLVVFAGVYKAQGTLTATLSDGSAPVYLDSSVNSISGQLSAAYTLHYKAATNNQTLGITYVQSNAGTSPYSNVTIQATALSLQ